MSNTPILTDNEAKFCLLFVNASAPLCGNVRECYKKVFNETDDAKALSEGKKLMKKESVIQRIEELNDYNVHNAANLKPQITETLLKIMYEMSDCQYKDKDGTLLSPAAARSVAVNAAKTLNDMYGVKEDIVHKIQLEGKNGSGITFNVVVPNKPQEQKDLEDCNG